MLSQDIVSYLLKYDFQITPDGIKFLMGQEKDIHIIIDKIIQENMDLPEVKEGGERAVKKLMGIAMKAYRGQYPGNKIHDLLQKKVSEL